MAMCCVHFICVCVSLSFLFSLSRPNLLSLSSFFLTLLHPPQSLSESVRESNPVSFNFCIKLNRYVNNMLSRSWFVCVCVFFFIFIFFYFYFYFYFFFFFFLGGGGGGCLVSLLAICIEELDENVWKLMFVFEQCLCGPRIMLGFFVNCLGSLKVDYHQVIRPLLQPRPYRKTVPGCQAGSSVCTFVEGRDNQRRTVRIRNQKYWTW